MQIIKKEILKYVNPEEHSNKYYIATVYIDNEIPNLLLQYGKNGRNPVEKNIPYKILEKALFEMKYKVASKVNKGYKRVSNNEVSFNKEPTPKYGRKTPVLIPLEMI